MLGGAGVPNTSSLRVSRCRGSRGRSVSKSGYGVLSRWSCRMSFRHVTIRLPAEWPNPAFERIAQTAAQHAQLHVERQLARTSCREVCADELIAADVPKFAISPKVGIASTTLTGRPRPGLAQSVTNLNGSNRCNAEVQARIPATTWCRTAKD
jgi:hypothetical protein